MKKQITTALLLTSLFFASCGIKQDGQIELKNGEDKPVSVKYSIAKFRYDEFVKAVSKDDFKLISEKASSEAKMKCKFMPTYDPKEITFNLNHDTVVAMVIFHAKNAMGVSDSQMSVSMFKGSSLISEAELNKPTEEEANRVADSIANELTKALAQ